MSNHQIDKLYQRCVEVYAKYQKMSIEDAAHILKKYNAKVYIEEELSSMTDSSDKELYQHIDWFIEDCRSV